MLLWLSAGLVVSLPLPALPYQQLVFNVLYGLLSVAMAAFVMAFYVLCRSDCRRAWFCKRPMPSAINVPTGTTATAVTVQDNSNLRHLTPSPTDSRVKYGPLKVSNLQSGGGSQLTDTSMSDLPTFYNPKQNGVAQKYWQKKRQRNLISQLNRDLSGTDAETQLSGEVTLLPYTKPDTSAYYIAPLPQHLRMPYAEKYTQRNGAVPRPRDFDGQSSVSGLQPDGHSSVSAPQADGHDSGSGIHNHSSGSGVPNHNSVSAVPNHSYRGGIQNHSSVSVPQNHVSVGVDMPDRNHGDELHVLVEEPRQHKEDNVEDSIQCDDVVKDIRLQQQGDTSSHVESDSTCGSKRRLGPSTSTAPYMFVNHSYQDRVRARLLQKKPNSRMPRSISAYDQPSSSSSSSSDTDSDSELWPRNKKETSV